MADTCFSGWCARKHDCKVQTERRDGTMTDKELKPCPFCGGEAKFQSGVICCSDCGVKMRYISSRKLAIAAWNRRVNDGKVDGD
jgi:Lar family restriction alleviation protein